jgi:plasmid stabilization system protein ParE
MKYDIFITPRAEQEAQANRDWWAINRSAEQAARCYEEFAVSVVSLTQTPDRCARAPEHGSFPYELRQLNFGIGSKATHRILFTIRTTDVVILRVRHLSQAEIEYTNLSATSWRNPSK